jgi:DNA-binding NarL/FixJ family response regulator
MFSPDAISDITDVVQNKANVARSHSAGPDIKVALVEDSQQLRRQLKHMLGRAPGVKCVCDCGSAEEALEKIPAAAPDVVLMDVNLPGISGIGCTARLKQLIPTLQVIMLTVYEDGENIFNALKAGACGYLLKRSSPAEILDAVSSVRQGGVPMTGEIARKVIMTFQTPAAGTEQVVLSSREQEILELLSEGLLNKEIADRLSISYHTVKVHLKHVYDKLHVRSRAEAMLKFMGDKAGTTAGSESSVGNSRSRRR